MNTPHIIGSVAMIVHEGEIYCRLHDIIAVADNDKTIRTTFAEDEQPIAPPPPATTRKSSGKSPKWDKPAAVKKKKTVTIERAGKKQYACKKCGTPGHRAKTCPQNTEDLEPASHMSEENASPAFSRGRISEEQFDQVKAMQDDGSNSMAICTQTGIALVQIGRMMNSEDYQEYLNKT